MLTNDVKNDIKELAKKLEIVTPFDVNGESLSDDCHFMQLTVACNDTGDKWNFQTGDNSYTGACYSLPHWYVTSVEKDVDRAELANQLIGGLEDILDELTD